MIEENDLMSELVEQQATDTLSKAICRGGFALGHCEICSEAVVYLDDGMCIICQYCIEKYGP